ncbi:hypothetical protein ACI65C_007111 [Semiaphis heraclei]
MASVILDVSLVILSARIEEVDSGIPRIMTLRENLSRSDIFCRSVGTRSTVEVGLELFVSSRARIRLLSVSFWVFRNSSIVLWKSTTDKGVGEEADVIDNFEDEEEL